MPVATEQKFAILSTFAIGFSMAFFANRNNVKPMLRRIAVPMVIFSGWMISIMALQGLRPGKFSSFDRMIYNMSGFGPIRMLFTISFGMVSSIQFAFFAVVISLSCYFTFICLAISSFGFKVINSAVWSLGIVFFVLQITFYTITSISIAACRVFVKLRKRFCFFASSAGFCYDLFSHNQLLISWLRLEPVSGYIPVSGLSYYSEGRGAVKCQIL